MSDFVINITSQEIPTQSVWDEAGRLCVHPETLSKLCYIQDAITLCILCFIAGMTVMWAFNYLEERWS